MLTNRQFYGGRPTPLIAQDLLGRQLTYQGPHGLVGGLIVEVEAYLGVTDTASHAYGGRRTGYTAALYGPPGTIYIYQIRSYYCFDVVVQPVGEPQGILIRALEPTVNPDQLYQNRPVMGVNLTNGPGKLMQALGIADRKLDGQSLQTSPLTIDLTTRRLPRHIAVSRRIGVNRAKADGDRPLRYYVAGNPYVSKTKRAEWDRSGHGWQVS